MKYLLGLSLLLTCCFSLQAQRFFRSELPTPLTTPWEITYGPDNFLWLTESWGRVSRVDPVTGDKTVVYTAPDYFPGSPLENSPLCPELPIGTGTLGLALHPDFTDPATSFIYFVYSYNSGTTALPVTKFRIKRLTWDAPADTVVGDTNLVNYITTGYDHLGGRLLAVKQQDTAYLFLSIGDNGRSEQNAPDCYSPQSTNPNNFTQYTSTQNGKIHRFHMDGTIPYDNPIPGNSFYTRGHRNPQGLMYNPNQDIVYAIEHGDRTDDEINVLHKGMNYGWKDVRGYHNDSSFIGESAFVANYVPNPLIPNDALIEPLYSWCTTPSTTGTWTDWCTVAPSDGIYYGSNGIPEWTNSLLVVTLKDGATTDKEVYQFQLDSTGSIVPSTPSDPNPKRFFSEDQDSNGRLRDIAISPDGMSIYLINNGGANSEKITVYTYDTLTSVQEVPARTIDVQLFPNPATTTLSFKGLENYPDLTDIHISTILGKTVPIAAEPPYQLDISRLPTGMYVVHLIFDNQTHALR